MTISNRQAILQTRHCGRYRMAIALACCLGCQIVCQTIGWSQTKKAASKALDQNWIERNEPGVQLIGRPRSVRNLLDSNTFTMTPDGKMLVGARGRELCIIDWDAQELVQTVKMPFQNGSVNGFQFWYSNNGRYLLVLLRWYGRPYDPTDELDLDAFQDYRLNHEFNYETFRGDRLLIYSSDYQLLHDLELTYDPTRIPDVKASFPNGVSGIHVLNDNNHAVIFGSPKTRVIDLESGKVVHEQTVHPWAIPVGDQIFDLRRSDGRLRGMWWDPATNEVSTDTELELPASPMPIRTGQAGRCFGVLDRQTSRLTIRSPDGRVEITVPKMGMLNTYAGTYSPDGRYYIFPSGETLTLVDLEQQKIWLQFRIPQDSMLSHLFFRPQHNTLIVQYGSQLSEISLDDHFERNFLAMANLIPISERLCFANQDQFLVVGDDCVLDLQSGTIRRRDRGHSEIQVFSPTANLAVQDAYQYIGHGSFYSQIEIGPADSEVRRMLYTSLPSLSPAMLRWGLGIAPAEYDSFWDNRNWIGTMTSHLSFCPAGETLRHIYIDSGRSIRLRLTHLQTRALMEDRNLESEIIQGMSTISPDGRRLAIFRNDTIEILDAATGQRLQTLAVPESIEHVGLDRRGDLLAVLTSWHGKRIVHVIDLATERVVFREEGIQFLGFGFRPGSDQFYLATRQTDLATRLSEKHLRFFDRETWDVVWEHTTDHDYAYGMAMSQDGTQAAFGLSTRRIELWRLSDVQPNNE